MKKLRRFRKFVLGRNLNTKGVLPGLNFLCLQYKMFSGVRSFPAARDVDITQYKQSCLNKQCKEYANLYPEEYKARSYLNMVCAKRAIAQVRAISAKEKDFGKCFDNMAKKTIINRKLTERNKCLKKKCSKQMWKRRTISKKR
jgi:hypothetical protein